MAELPNKSNKPNYKGDLSCNFDPQGQSLMAMAHVPGMPDGEAGAVFAFQSKPDARISSHGPLEGGPPKETIDKIGASMVNDCRAARNQVKP